MSNSSWRVRSAEPADRNDIIDVVRRAFTGDDRDGGDEVEIVRKTWELEASPPGLELVATDVGRVIGHVLGATADIGDTTVVAVAPLSVVPDRQGEGIGRIGRKFFQPRRS